MQGGACRMCPRAVHALAIAIAVLLAHTPGTTGRGEAGGRLEVRCETAAECGGGGGRCEAGVCVDWPGGGGVATAAPVTVLGGACAEDGGCHVSGGGVCVGRPGRCECPEGLLGSEDGRACLRASAGLLQPCEEDVQCESSVEHSRCHPQRRVCDCRPPARKERFTCVPLGLPCREDEQCERLLGPGGACLSGAEVCGCAAPSYLLAANGTACEPASRLDQPCRRDEDCRDLDGLLLMSCQDGACRCHSPYRRLRDLCISRATSLRDTAILFISIILIQFI